MLFTRVALSALTLSPIVGVLAGHSSPRGFVTRPYGTGHKGTSRRDVISVAATFTTAQSQMDKLLSEAGTQPITDLSVAEQFLSSVNDCSNTVVANTDTCQPGADNLLLDLDGSKLTDEQLGDKIVALVKSFGTACTLVKDLGNADLADLMQTIALNTELVQDDLDRCAPDVAKMSVVADTMKATQDSLFAMMEEAYGPEPADD